MGSGPQRGNRVLHSLYFLKYCEVLCTTVQMIWAASNIWDNVMDELPGKGPSLAQGGWLALFWQWSLLIALVPMPSDLANNCPSCKPTTEVML